MTLTFSARISGAEILCDIGTDSALTAPVFCFSLMAAARVVSGGEMVRRLAGYAEVALPDIAAGSVHRVVLAYDNPDYRPKNRAWLPLGGFLRLGKTCVALPDGFDLGVRPQMPPPPGPLPHLPIVPPVQDFRATHGKITLTHLAPHPALTSADDLAQRLNLPPLLATGGHKVEVTIGPDMADDSYRLTIADTITIQAGSKAGAHYAAITLLTLRETLQGALPCGVITDAPRFPWRGQHLDCARHFFAVDFILHLLDLMALLKLNRFHWHFADDEAFRLQVACAPDLWRKTEFRGAHDLMPGVFGGGIRSGGSYSRADVARILAHAAALHIQVLPEIEVPAHSHAMIAALPGLRDPGDNGQEISVQGYGDNVVNPAMPATWELLPALMDEITALFPMPMLHLGCDEAPHGTWSGSPKVRALMAEQGLANADDVQGWMMARLAQHLATKGIQSAAWEEAIKGAQGGIGHQAVIFSWTGQGAGVQAARMGHPVVMCPAQHTYFDLAHSADPDDWGATWAGVLPLEQTVDWEPAPEIAAHILGVQGCFWGEFTTQDWQARAMIAPRILGLACKAWENAGTTKPEHLPHLAGHYAPILRAMGWT